MKKLLLSLVLISSVPVLAQKAYTVEIGNNTQQFKGVELLPDSLETSTYYNIQDGYFDYYYVQSFDGKVIQYDHLYGPVTVLDAGSETYNIKKNFTVMIIKTKGRTLEIMVDSWKADEGKVKKTEFTSDQIEMFIPDEDTGKKMVKQIKKGRNL